MLALAADRTCMMRMCVWSVVQLYARCTVTLESAYYNEKLAIWEPLIEPVEHRQTDTHKPWQVTVEVCNVYIAQGFQLLMLWV